MESKKIRELVDEGYSGEEIERILDHDRHLRGRRRRLYDKLKESEKRHNQVKEEVDGYLAETQKLCPHFEVEFHAAQYDSFAQCTLCGATARTADRLLAKNPAPGSVGADCTKWFAAEAEREDTLPSDG